MLRKISVILLNLTVAMTVAWGAVHSCLPEVPATTTIEVGDQTDGIKLLVTSPLMGPLQACLNSFKSERPEFKLSLVSTDAQDGMSRLLSRGTDLVILGRPVTQTEQKRANGLHIALQTQQLGWDGVGIWVQPMVSRVLPSISFDQLQKIFVTHEIKRWEELAPGKLEGAILPTAPSPKSEFAEWFLNRVSPSQRMFGKHVIIEENVERIPSSLLQNRQSIGLMPAMVQIDGLATLALTDTSGTTRCGESTLRTGEYPLSLPITAVLNAETVGGAKEFYRYLASIEGQHVLYRAGLATSLIPPKNPDPVPRESPSEHGSDAHGAAAHGGGHGASEKPSAHGAPSSH